MKTTTRAETRHIAATLRHATDDDLRHGAAWYDNARRHATAIARRHDIETSRASAVIAALSPRNPWARNLLDATLVIRHWYTGADPLTVPVSTFKNNLRKAVRILDAPLADIDTILYGTAGRKVLAFHHSILGDDPTAVTIDGHAYSIWTGHRHVLANVPHIGKRLYETIARAYTLTAKRSTDIIGIELTPQQVQAVTWTTYRRIHAIA